MTTGHNAPRIEWDTDFVDSESRWGEYVIVIAIVLAVKMVVIGWGVGQATPERFSRGDYQRNYHHHRIIGRYEHPPRFDFFELWVVSDAQWYLAIAEDGYPTRSEFDTDRTTSRPKLIASTDTQLKYAFYPLWPAVIYLTRSVFSDVNKAAFISANIISLIALCTLYGFLRGVAGRSAAFWTVVLLTASPFAIFLHVPFTEPLFLLLTILTFIACHKHRWLIAGVCIGLAAVARPNGVALFVVPLVQFIATVKHRGSWSFKRAAGMWPLLVAFVPLGLFYWHNASKTGDPLYFVQATEWWGYEPSQVWRNLWSNTVGMAIRFSTLPWHGFHHSRMDFLVLITSVVALVAGLRRIPAHFSAYAAAVILIPLLTKDLMSFSRYVLVAWPLFLVPAVLVPHRLRAILLGTLSVLCLLAQMSNMGSFVNWHWVG